MIATETLLLFLLASLALNLTPGPDMLFCLASGLKGGPKPGIAAALGVATGGLIHTILAALGLAALLQATPVAFDVLRYIGIAYLLFLAWQSWNTRDLSLTERRGRDEAVAAWRRGTVTNLLNPKVALFVLAFLPQFVDPERGSTLVQFLVLGLIFNTSGTIVNGAVALGAGRLRLFLENRPEAARITNRISALLMLALAGRLAWESAGT